MSLRGGQQPHRHPARRHRWGRVLPGATERPPAPFGPDAIEVHARSLRLGDEWCRTVSITGYPREVGLGWLEPLATHPGRLDVALHIEPVPAAVAADRLRRQLARLESGRRADAAKGRLVDPEVEVAAEDARDLAAGLARGEQKLFRARCSPSTTSGGASPTPRRDGAGW